MQPSRIQATSACYEALRLANCWISLFIQGCSCPGGPGTQYLRFFES